MHGDVHLLIIIRDTTLLYLSYLYGDSVNVNKIMEQIADKAFRYGLTPKKIKVDTISQVLRIIQLAESRI